MTLLELVDMNADTMDEGLNQMAQTLRQHYRYVSASDELKDPNSVINNAEPNEPVFVLRARDVVSTQAIDWWLWCARNRGVPEEKLNRADAQLQAMEMWVEKRVPQNSFDGSIPIVRTAKVELDDPNSVLNSCHPDEPVFVLVGSDVVAVEVIEYWAYLASQNGAPRAKVTSAMEVAKAMARWSSKRVVGVKTRGAVRITHTEEFEPDQNGARNHAGAPPRWKHKTIAKLVCLKCGFEKKVAEPPFNEQVLADLARQANQPCPDCGAVHQIDPETNRQVRALTTKMVPEN